MTDLINKIHLCDCMDVMLKLPDKSVDLVLTDPPYGYLKHRLDCPFDETAVFGEFNRILKDSGALVIDSFSGSGATAIACTRVNRKFICIEKDPEYHAASVKRLEEYNNQTRMVL